MENEEVMTNDIGEAAEAADQSLGEIVEEDYQSEESLDSLKEDDNAEGGEDEAKPEEEQEERSKGSGTNEPGYVQKRVDKAVQKALAAERDSIRAEMEAQYAPIRQRLMEMDAQELLRKGVVKDIEIARELVRLRNGQPAAEENSQPRNDQGQFESRDKIIRNAKTEARIEELKKQAAKIKDARGIDVIKEFMNNEDVKNAIVSGDMDFYDVANQMQESQQTKRRSPSPTRSPNGASGRSPNAIEQMSDEQFARMEKRISEGARYRLK